MLVSQAEVPFSQDRGMPRQAVILAGGRGVRLRPITDHLPKPMIDVAGTPFLGHLIRSLERKGVQRVLILTGYKKEIVHNYFIDNPDYNIEITFSEGEEEWDTGKRLSYAAHLLDEYFFLLYGDNYTPINYQDLWNYFFQKECDLQIVAREKVKGNLVVDITTNKVLAYDKLRQDPEARYVDLGFMTCRRDAVLSILESEPNPSFNIVIEKLATEGRLLIYKTPHPYLSISDIERLNITREYFSTKKIILVDRDGTLNSKPLNARYVTTVDELEILEDAKHGVRNLAEHGYSFVVITNQAGVATGDVTSEALNKIHEKLAASFAELGVPLLGIYTCTDHWSDQKSLRRKPAPGMFIEASNDHRFLLETTYYVGDDPRDMEAARNAGCSGIFLSKEPRVFENRQHPDYLAPDWNAVCDYILRNER